MESEEKRTIPLDEVLDDWMQDPAFRAAAAELEPAYQLARLRIAKGLTQKELAEMINTHQSSIARFESGTRAPSWEMMNRIAEALGCVVQVRVVPKPALTE